MSAPSSEKKNEEDLDVLAEDDEFEEFEAETWDQAEEEAEDEQLWGDNWDDDELHDDFTKQLRQEFAKQQNKNEMKE